MKTKLIAPLFFVLPSFAFADAGSIPMTSMDSPNVSRPLHCRKPFPSLEQMEKELQEMSKAEPRIDYAVGGLAIKDESVHLIRSYRELTSYKTYQARPTNDIDFWHLFKDRTDCQKTLCGIQIVYGRELGTVFLYVMAKYGLNLSHRGYEKLTPPTPKDQAEFETYFWTRPWTLEELTPYLQGIFELPESQLPLFPTRMTHSGIKHRLNENILSNGTIQFYTPVDTREPEVKERLAYHEIAHNIGYYTGLDRSKEWTDITGWVLRDGKVVRIKEGGLVTHYAGKEFFEDFAESFVYYRFEPEVLKQVSPERYEYMRTKVFGGREYLRDQACP